MFRSPDDEPDEGMYHMPLDVEEIQQFQLVNAIRETAKLASEAEATRKKREQVEEQLWRDRIRAILVYTGCTVMVVVMIILKVTGVI